MLTAEEAENFVRSIQHRNAVLEARCRALQAAVEVLQELVRGTSHEAPLCPKCLETVGARGES